MNMNRPPLLETKNEAVIDDEVKLTLSDFEFKMSDDNTKPGVFTGYGSYFGNVDQGKDIVDAKAFDEWLKAAGPKPHMFFNHNQNEPIGEWKDIAPDRKGLKMTGELWLGKGIPKAEQAYLLLKSKGGAGLSIGFQTTKAAYDDKKGTRTILGADLREVSVVTYPMNQKALVTGIKSALEGKDHLTVREAEGWLRDVAQLSVSDAKAFLAKLTKGLDLQRDADVKDAEEAAEFKATLERINNIFG